MQEANVIEQSQPVEAVGTEIAAPAPTMTLCSYGNKLTREELAQLKTPAVPIGKFMVTGFSASRWESR